MDNTINPFQSNEKRRKSGEICSLCGKSMGRKYSQTIQHLYLRHGEPFKEEDIASGLVVKCRYDGCTFMTANKLVVNNHIIKHHDPDYLDKIGQQFQCPICTKVYSMKLYLDNHIKTVHMSEDQPQFQCNICKKHFKRDVNLQEHVRRVHMNEEDICPHCGYHSKGGITAMKFHMITKHNDTSFGEVHIYKCQYCDFQTYGRQRHRIHVKKKHEIPLGIQKMDVLCDLCGQAFPSQNLMYNHRKLHDEKYRTRYKCIYCTYTTYVRLNLKRHLERVHRDRPMPEIKCHFTGASRD